MPPFVVPEAVYKDYEAALKSLVDAYPRVSYDVIYDLFTSELEKLKGRDVKLTNFFPDTLKHIVSGILDLRFTRNAFIAHPVTQLIDPDTKQLPELFTERFEGIEKVILLHEYGEVTNSFNPLKHNPGGKYQGLSSPSKIAIYSSRLIIGFPVIKYKGKEVHSHGVISDISYARSLENRTLFLFFPSDIIPGSISRMYDDMQNDGKTSLLFYKDDSEIYKQLDMFVERFRYL